MVRAQIVVDADTGNEMDDLYALTRILLDPEAKVAAVISSHFNNSQLLTDSVWHIYETRDIRTVDISQELNENILLSLGKYAIPHPKGADRMLGYAWGFYEGAPVPEAPAIDFLIELAGNVPEGEKMTIAVLGPLTNVAAMLELRPDLVDKIRVYFLGMSFDPSNGVWNKNEFNARNDLNALDQLLSNAALEFYIMPISTARRFRFEREATMKILSALDLRITGLLQRRWEEVHAGSSWIMWDLALIEAILQPGLAGYSAWAVPPENGSHKVYVYTHIDTEEMKEDFWRILSDN